MVKNSVTGACFRPIIHPDSVIIEAGRSTMITQNLANLESVEVTLYAHLLRNIFNNIGPAHSLLGMIAFPLTLYSFYFMLACVI